MKAVLPDAGATPDASTPARRLLRYERSALFLLIGTEAVVLAILIRNSYFYADDVLSFIDAHRLGLSWKLVTLNVYGHVAPFERLSHLLIVDVDPLSYVLGAAVIVVLWAALLAALAWNLLELRVKWRTSAFLLLLVGISTVSINEALYYDQTVFLVPATTFVLLVTAFYLRWQRTGRFRHLACSWLLFALSFVTQERPIVAIPYLVTLRYCVLVWQPPPGRPRRRILGEWRVWTPYAVVAALYVYYYSRFQPKAYPSLAQTLTFGLIAPENFLRAAVGVPLVHSPLWLSVSGLVVVVGLAAWFAARARRRPQFGRAALFGVMALVVNLYPVMRGVGGVVGPQGVADQLQYYLDPLCGFALAVGLAESSLTAGGPRMWSKRQPAVPLPRRVHVRPRQALMGGSFMAAALLVHAVALGYSLPKVFAANQYQVAAGRWEHNLEASLAATDREAGHATIVPLLLPGFYEPGFEAPFNREDMYFGLLPSYHKFDTGPVQIVDPYGTLDTVFASSATQLSASGAGRRAFSFSGMSAVPSPAGTTCAEGSSSYGTLRMALPTVVGQVGSGATVAMDISMSAGTKASLVPYSSLEGVTTFSPEPVTLSAGDRRIVVAIPGQAADQVGFVHVPPHIRFCVRGAEVGILSYPASGTVPCRAANSSGAPTMPVPCGRPWD